jgi:hypothetical protein
VNEGDDHKLNEQPPEPSTMPRWVTHAVWAIFLIFVVACLGLFMTGLYRWLT